MCRLPVSEANIPPRTRDQALQLSGHKHLTELTQSRAFSSCKPPYLIICVGDAIRTNVVLLLSRLELEVRTWPPAWLRTARLLSLLRQYQVPRVFCADTVSNGMLLDPPDCHATRLQRLGIL
jgi:hypothetical protein